MHCVWRILTFESIFNSNNISGRFFANLIKRQRIPNHQILNKYPASMFSRHPVDDVIFGVCLLDLLVSMFFVGIYINFLFSRGIFSLEWNFHTNLITYHLASIFFKYPEFKTKNKHPKVVPSYTVIKENYKGFNEMTISVWGFLTKAWL